MSGWDEDELQTVLDNCDNDSEAAMPNAFCSDFLTFRGKPKQEGVQVEDLDIRADLEKIQPAPVNVKAWISAEEVTNVPQPPRGSCTGTLIGASGGGGGGSNVTTGKMSGFDHGAMMINIGNFS